MHQKQKWSPCGTSVFKGQIPRQEAQGRNSDQTAEAAKLHADFQHCDVSPLLSFLQQSPFQLGIRAAKNKVASV